MIIGHFSGIPFSEFSRALLPAALVGLAINFSILRFGFRKVLRDATIDRTEHVVPKLERGLFVLVCVALVSIFAGFLTGLNLAWTAMAGAALVMVLARRDTHDVLKLVDWHLLLFFAALFCGSRRPKRYGPARCDLFANAADLWLYHAGADVEPGLVFRGWL